MRAGRWPEVVGVTATVDDERVVVVGSKGPHYLYLYDGRVGALPRRRLRPESSGANVVILYEAGYFGALFPRWKWTLLRRPVGLVEALWSAIVAEASSRDLTALLDERQPAVVAADLPDAASPLYGVHFPPKTRT